MKKTILLVTLCLVSAAVFAQDVYTSSGHIGYHKKHKKKGYDPDKVIIGGGFDIGADGSNVELGVSPLVGYRFTKDFSAGVGLGYQYYRYATGTDYVNTYYIDENIIFPSVWARYFVFRNFFLTGSFEYDFINMKGDNLSNYGTVYSENANVTAPCLLVGAGIRQPLGGRVSGVLEIVRDVIQDQNSPYFQVPFTMRVGIFMGL